MRFDFERKGLWLGVAGGLLVLGAVLIVLPFALSAGSANASGAGRRPLAAGSDLATAAGADTHTVEASLASGQASPSAGASMALATSTPASATPPAVAVTPIGAASAQLSMLDAYRGLGSWVDIYDDRAWSDPSGAVADMSRHGVRTLFLETANSRFNVAVKDPASTAKFIQASHAAGMKVVAWYLPDLNDSAKDFSRIGQAIAFQTADGQKFDSFALDIESSVVKSESGRNRALKALSARIRALVGTSYPLGAIIPSPAGLAMKKGYWNDFPYTSLAQQYDVFVPMSYYTYHGKTASAAYADTRANVRLIRQQPGCATIPIHLIGGIAENSSAAQLAAFVRAGREDSVFGASFYSWPGTTAADWRELAAIKAP